MLFLIRALPFPSCCIMAAAFLLSCRICLTGTCSCLSCCKAREFNAHNHPGSASMESFIALRKSFSASYTTAESNGTETTSTLNRVNELEISKTSWVGFLRTVPAWGTAVSGHQSRISKTELTAARLLRCTDVTNTSQHFYNFTRA